MLAVETDLGSDSFSDATLATWHSQKTAEQVDWQLAAVTCTQLWSVICTYTSMPTYAGQHLAFQLQKTKCCRIVNQPTALETSNSKCFSTVVDISSLDWRYTTSI